MNHHSLSCQSNAITTTPTVVFRGKSQRDQMVVHTSILSWSEKINENGFIIKLILISIIQCKSRRDLMGSAYFKIFSIIAEQEQNRFCLHQCKNSSLLELFVSFQCCFPESVFEPTTLNLPIQCHNHFTNNVI